MAAAEGFDEHAGAGFPPDYDIFANVQLAVCMHVALHLHAETITSGSISCGGQQYSKNMCP
jgi:hypothetical protein